MADTPPEDTTVEEPTPVEEAPFAPEDTPTDPEDNSAGDTPPEDTTVEEPGEAAPTEEPGETNTDDIQAQIERNREAAAKAAAEASADVGLLVNAPIADVTNRPVVSLDDSAQFPSSLPVSSPSIATRTDLITAEDLARVSEDTVRDAGTGALTVEDPDTDVLADPATHPDVLRASGPTVSEGPPAGPDTPAPAGEAGDDSVTFVSHRYPSLVAYSRDGSYLGQFRDGRLTTSDPGAIATLDAMEGVERA